MPRLEIENVSKRFGDFRALNGVRLSIPAGELLCLLGPSGCGKTTLLRIVAGLEAADGGRILLDGEEVSRLPPHKRDIGMVFQSHALFPHLSAAENIAYGLRIAGVDKREQNRRTNELLRMVRLPDAGGKRISQLSGGQRQRISIARALARKPKIFLLDEPTSSLDANLRETMQIELRHLQRNLNITTIVVTHDQSEAMTLADWIVVMKDGEIEQVGSPLEIYDRPRTAFVANFIGATNMLNGIRRGEFIRVDGVNLRAEFVGKKPGEGDESAISIRPERVKLSAPRADTNGENYLAGKIEFVRNTGNLVEIHADAGGAKIVHSYSPQSSPLADWKSGDAVLVHLPPDHCLAYPK